MTPWCFPFLQFIIWAAIVCLVAIYKFCIEVLGAFYIKGEPLLELMVIRTWIPIWNRHEDKGVLLVVNFQSVPTILWHILGLKNKWQLKSHGILLDWLCPHVCTLWDQAMWTFQLARVWLTPIEGTWMFGEPFSKLIIFPI